MNDEIEQTLRDHYQPHHIPDSRVDEILDFCQPARQIAKWRRLTFLGFGTAVAAIVLLLAVVASQPVETVTPEVAQERTPEVDLEHKDEQPETPKISIPAVHQPKQFQLVAVKIHADPCGRCKKIAPVFDSLQKEFSDDPVLFLTFDLTSKSSRLQAERLSQTLGIETVFNKHRYTGVIVLATPDGQVWDVLDSDADVSLAVEVLSRNLISG